jgi:hypothetical protein
VPISEDSLSLEERIQNLESQGWIEPKKTIKSLPPPIPLPDKIAQKYLQESRDS